MPLVDLTLIFSSREETSSSLVGEAGRGCERQAFVKDAAVNKTYLLESTLNSLIL